MRVLLCIFVFVFAKTGEGVDFANYDTYSRFQKKMNLNPPNLGEPVPFGHITREGFGDPFSSIKQPKDSLELSLRMPKNAREALELLQSAKGSNILFLNPNIPKFFGKPSPKEEMLLERFINPEKETNQTMLKWYDLPTIQARNAMMPPKHQYIPKKKTLAGAGAGDPIPPPSAPIAGKQQFFSKNSFQLAIEPPEEPMNWTTCDEFAAGAVFSPKDVVNLKWTPFYIWDNMEIDVAKEHTFEYPTNKLVNEYHAKYGKMLNKTVDWSKTKLLMNGISEALLIAADKRGLFDVIPKHDIPKSITSDMKLPAVSLRIKIEDPYLVMTYCEHHFATVMAVSGNEPTDAKEMMAEAATIKFVGSGRPVWRDYNAEKEKIKAEQDAKIREEDEKIIVVNEPMPPVGQWD